MQDLVIGFDPGFGPDVQALERVMERVIGIDHAGMNGQKRKNSLNTNTGRKWVPGKG